MDRVKHPVKNRISNLRFEITANTKNTIIEAGSAEINVNHKRSRTVSKRVNITKTKTASIQTDDTIKNDNLIK